jgi:hypothetical protein
MAAALLPTTPTRKRVSGHNLLPTVLACRGEASEIGEGIRSVPALARRDRGIVDGNAPVRAERRAFGTVRCVREVVSNCTEWIHAWISRQ